VNTEEKLKARMGALEFCVEILLANALATRPMAEVEAFMADMRANARRPLVPVGQAAGVPQAVTHQLAVAEEVDQFSYKLAQRVENIRRINAART
jgi:hypothetical protein